MIRPEEISTMVIFPDKFHWFELFVKVTAIVPSGLGSLYQAGWSLNCVYAPLEHFFAQVLLDYFMVQHLFYSLCTKLFQ